MKNDAAKIPVGKQSIQNQWFFMLKETADYFCECVNTKERARIVIDYDPEESHTEITYYRGTEPRSPAEG